MSVRSLRERMSKVDPWEARYETLLEETVRALLSTLLAKDATTSRHSLRVAEFALLIGRALKLSHEQLVDLELGAMLHDIGKIGIPDNILLKPGPLTEEEYEIMKKHPVISAAILSKISSLQRILPIVKHHQERIDGQGYPDALRGEAIPMLARVTFIADAFDAMISDRPYRKPKSEKEALAELKRCAGSQFDARYVDVFLGAYANRRRSSVASEFFPSQKKSKISGD